MCVWLSRSCESYSADYIVVRWMFVFEAWARRETLILGGWDLRRAVVVRTRGGAGLQPARGVQPRPLVRTAGPIETGPQAERLPRHTA